MITAPAFQAVIDAHNAAMRLERGLGAEVDVWHLLVSLRQYCDAREVSVILRGLSDTVADSDAGYGVLFDVNGNRVG